jgi:hypothetical protein
MWGCSHVKRSGLHGIQLSAHLTTRSNTLWISYTKLNFRLRWKVLGFAASESAPLNERHGRKLGAHAPMAYVLSNRHTWK